MWNWKTVYEDDTYAFYCDLSNIIDTVGDEERCYAGADCYMPLPERCGIWTSLFLKKKTAIKRYVAARKKSGFSIAGYEDYHYSLCLIEFDTGTMKYRVIPAADYDEKNQQIGDSELLDVVDPPLIDGLTVDWSSIRSKKTHPMIKALYKLFSASA
jgi:hypothetical protein